MSTAALRQRVYRERERSGRIVLQIEVDEVEITEILIAARLLDPLGEHDRGDLAHGVERLLLAVASNSPP